MEFVNYPLMDFAYRTLQMFYECDMNGEFEYLKG